MHRTAVIRFLLAALVAGAPTAPAAAQAPDTTRAAAVPVDSAAYRPRPLRAWEAGAVAAGAVVTIAVADVPIKDWSQDPQHRSTAAGDVATAFRYFGEPEVWLPVTGGIILTGLVAGKPGILHSGLRIGASLVVVGVVTQLGKLTFGRTRPNGTDDEWAFDPFSGEESMWSGHTATAFAFATSLAQEIHNPWATAGLYTIATGTAWSRVYDNKHWASDVLVGAAVGIASAKLATGRWTLFGLRAPVPLASDGRVGLAWHGTF